MRLLFKNLLIILSVFSGIILASLEETYRLPHQRLRDLLLKHKSSVTSVKNPLEKLGIGSRGVPVLKFSDLIPVFEADAYFTGSWDASPDTPNIMNGFVNRNGNSYSFFKVFEGGDPADQNTTQVVVLYTDQVL